METAELKEYIYDNEQIELILDELGCKYIKLRKTQGGDEYFSCAFPDGDNKNGIWVFNNEYLNVQSKSRPNAIKNPYGNPNLIDVVCYIKDLYFFEAKKWICECLGLDYYKESADEIPESLKWTKEIMGMKEKEDEIDNEKLKPISEKILTYYYSYCNDIFLDEGIDYFTQREFEIGYDIFSDRITIPIRDELSTLVGVKGRLIEENSEECKYIYLEPCSKSKILYGLYKVLPYIKASKKVIVVESEKSVLKLWSNGIRNVVAIGGHELSKTQVEKLIRLEVDEIIICYDEDVFRNENGKVNKKEYLNEARKFIEQQKVSAMVDINGYILDKKESPADNLDKFKKMLEDRKVLQEGC
ncbi:toprim domain-containing protein [Clostridium perfringens]|uniref:toprim domain-containing protein n=1 Tax=Clostridium perfringens TaxID=1502 RepID=UPI003749C5AE